MTKEKLLERLRIRKEKFETDKAAAESFGISPSHLCDVLKGKREPAGQLLVALNVERVTTYREIA